VPAADFMCVCVIDECDKRSVYSVFHIIICCIMLNDGEGCDLVSVTFVMPSCVCVCVCVCVAINDEEMAMVRD
jgi:hypothetical protein